MQSSRCVVLVALLAAGLTGCGRKEAAASGPFGDMKELRIAARAAEEDPERAATWKTYRELIAKVTGLPVKLYESADYNGTIQALSSGQVDVASMAGGAYANVNAQIGDLATPILSMREAEGNTGYYSALIVRADSPYRTLADLRGKTIGYPDFNSTSGYLYPREKMRQEGFDPDKFFAKAVFAGGHTQSIMALETASSMAQSST
jgi:phosphonate transport system substrate-binding protein